MRLQHAASPISPGWLPPGSLWTLLATLKIAMRITHNKNQLLQTLTLPEDYKETQDMTVCIVSD